ncbi:hypothetical protein JCM10296v2_007734 [Rhodotorula toruloides]
MPKREPCLRHNLAHHVLTNSFVRSWDDGSHSHNWRPSLLELMKDQVGEVDRDATDVRKCKYEMDMGHAKDDEIQELIKQHRLAEHNLHEWTDIRDETFEGPAARKLADEIWQQVDHAFDARWVVVKLQYVIGDAEHYHSSIWKRVNGAPSRTPSPPPGLTSEPHIAGHSLTLPVRPHDHLPEAPKPPTGLGLGLERPPSRPGRHDDAEHAVGKAGRYRMRRRYFGERY